MLTGSVCLEDPAKGPGAQLLAQLQPVLRELDASVEKKVLLELNGERSS